MARSRINRAAAIAAASIVFHVLLISALAIGLPRSDQVQTPEQTAIEVTLERPPAPPPETKSPTKPATTRPAPNQSAAPPAQSPSPVAARAPTSPPAAAPVDAGAAAAIGDLVRALRGSVGCSNPDTAGLTETERAACRRRFHAGLEDAKPLGGLTDEKRGRFDRAVRCKREYEDAPVPAANSASNAAGGIPGLGYIPRLRDCPPGTE